MEIIKKGSLPAIKCRECNCEFTYTNEDIIKSYPFSAREESVKCPECKKIIVINIEYY